MGYDEPEWAPKLERLLHTFKLSMYEARAYTVLVISGRLSASDVAIQSAIPSPRVYSVLSSLLKRGYIKQIRKDPVVYEAMHPGNLLRTEFALLKQTVDFSLPTIEEYYESHFSNPETTYVSFAQGRTGFISELMDAAKNTREILGIIGSFDATVIKTLDTMTMNASKACSTSIIVPRSGDLEKVKPILQRTRFSSRSIKYSASLHNSFFVFDQTKTVAEISASSSSSDRPVIVVSDSDFSKPFVEWFRKLWNESEELQQMNRSR